MRQQISQAARYSMFIAVTAFGVFTIVASGGGGPATPPTVGSIFVYPSFGAVTSTPSPCTGSGRITITPQSLTGSSGQSTSSNLPFSYSGFSSTTPNEPACQANANFTNLRPGTWRVSDGIATCPATVVAGQGATVKIRNEVCQ
jgi:hypothetical protein